MAEKGFAEDRMGRAIDRCFSDAVIKAGESTCYNFCYIRDWIIEFFQKIFSGVGLTLGGVFSLFFFKRRMWPVYGGGFFGLGVAYNNCEKALNSN
jgi:Domain of unknown function (DUF543)